MLRHPRVWIAVAGAFALANVAGATMAAIAREPMHAATHLVFALLAGAVAQALVGVVREGDGTLGVPVGIPAEFTEHRLAHLEISLEGLASGVGQMVEGQRTVARLFAERAPERPERVEHDDGDAD